MTNTQEPDPFDGIDFHCCDCGKAITPEEEVVCEFCGCLCCIHCASIKHNRWMVCKDCLEDE